MPAATDHPRVAAWLHIVSGLCILLVMSGTLAWVASSYGSSTLPEGVKAMHNADDIVVSVRMKKTEEAVAAVPGAEGEAAKEPEVLARGKKEEEGAGEEK